MSSVNIIIMDKPSYYNPKAEKSESRKIRKKKMRKKKKQKIIKGCLWDTKYTIMNP